MGGLGFLVPAFLAGLAALALPVLFHLRHRERDRPHRFPSLMFLRRIPIRTAQRRRITDWLLLLLRAAVVALLVAAFARPFVGRTTATVAATPSRTVVLLLDRSLSMGHRAVWPVALDSARAVIASLGAGDRVAVVLFDEDAQVAQALTPDHALARAAVDGAGPTTRGTRYAAALRAARRVVAEAHAVTAEVVVVTDLQRTGLDGLAGLELPPELHVRTVAVVPPKRPDASLAGADIQRVPDGDRSRLLVSARVMLRDRPAAARGRISLVLNGRAAGGREVTLPADGALTVAFDPVPLPKGRAVGSVALESDGLPANDTLRFVVPAEEALRVLLIVPADAPAEETLFLERALAIGRAPSLVVERRRAASLNAASLRGAAVVLLFDTPVPGGAALSTWIREGGGLIVAAGRRLSARSSGSALLPGTIRGAVERMNDRGGAFGEVSLEHPVFTPFRDGGAAALGAARFLRYARVTADSGAEVLARFDDGNPALLERKAGAGRILLLAAPLDAVSGDFPLQPAFLPFLRRLSLHAVGYEPPPVWRSTGETAFTPRGLKDPVVSTPDGSLVRPPGDSGARAVALPAAGFYDVYEGRAAGEPALVVAANPPAAESDLTAADPRELLLGVRRSDSAQAEPSGPEAPADREGRQRLWRLLLAGAALLLLVETLVANRGWRATATVVLPAPPERSTP
ncbi:MAG TPA: BatA domain-containing protein [Gemmatimonadales bacterium]|nr:BatA domain-containing protein [Gemmatimonadales bacterium]